MYDTRNGMRSFGGGQSAGAPASAPMRPSTMGAQAPRLGGSYFGDMLDYNLRRSGGVAPMTQADVRERAFDNMLKEQDFQMWLQRSGLGQQLFETDNKNRFNFMRDLLPGLLDMAGNLGGAALTGGLGTIKPK